MGRLNSLKRTEKTFVWSTRKFKGRGRLMPCPGAWVPLGDVSKTYELGRLGVNGDYDMDYHIYNIAFRGY